ncbi:DUF6907 domain-containing protein [Streptomyces sp. bgisy095]|uniref:DUF6907 domain-containing protein n=1 Tax=unclassified Streptomyces TaxID=2593676 RepID=UPI003D737408
MNIVSLPTFDGGAVRLVEPSWCAGHADHVPCHRVDLSHTGTEHQLTLFDGNDLMRAMLSRYPCSTAPEQCRTGLYVEQGGYAATLDAEGVRRLAGTLTAHAMELRRLADRLAVLENEEAES